MRSAGDAASNTNSPNPSSLRKNSLRGFFSVRLQSGLVLHSCKVMAGAGSFGLLCQPSRRSTTTGGTRSMQRQEDVRASRRNSGPGGPQTFPQPSDRGNRARCARAARRRRSAMTPLDQALSYAEAFSWPVFPCREASMRCAGHASCYGPSSVGQTGPSARRCRSGRMRRSINGWQAGSAAIPTGRHQATRPIAGLYPASGPAGQRFNADGHWCPLTRPQGLGDSQERFEYRDAGLRSASRDGPGVPGSLSTARDLGRDLPDALSSIGRSAAMQVETEMQ